MGEISRLEHEIAEFETRGTKPLSNFNRFDSAALEYEYQSIYWLLCLEGHNNISALNDRHIEENGNEFNVVLFKEANPLDLVRIVDALLAVVTDSGCRVHNFFNTLSAKHFEGHQQTLDNYRASYTCDPN